jgi:hypothetical protein
VHSKRVARVQGPSQTKWTADPLKDRCMQVKSAIHQPNRRGIRPIAMSEAWLHLAAIVCIKLLPDAGLSLIRCRLGVGIQGAAENSGHAINAALHSDPNSTVVLSHD